MATGQAIVCEIKKHIPIPDRDIIVSAHIFGENIIINKETTPVGTRGILIDCESVLDHDFCSSLNLFRHETLNKDITKKGYIEDSGRVRAIKFNKVPSSALFVSFEQLETIPKLKGINKLKDGTQLNEYNGIKICDKYIRKFKVGGKGPPKLKKNICPSFHEHQDTEQLMRNLGIFNENNILTTTTKIHGCVEYSTIVETLEYGPQKIGEIVNNKTKCHILGRDIIKNEDIYIPIDNFYKIENDGEWYEIEMENGIKIKITGNNPVWLTKEKCYRRVDNLKVGDDLMIHEIS